MKHILLVEDDPQITDLLHLHLHSSQYMVSSCTKGREAFDMVSGNAYNLIILDIMLPDMNGIQVCRQLRELDCRTPIMMLSSLADETDKVLALELGADDYVTKPFGIFELLARTKALLRREQELAVRSASRFGQSDTGQTAQQGLAPSGQPTAHGPAGNIGSASPELAFVIRYKDLEIDEHEKKGIGAGRRMELTPKEFDLLLLLASHPGKSFTRHELLEMIWGFAFQEYEHTVTAHINRLRIKIEQDLHHPEYILTSWGVGYRFAE